MNMGVGIMEKRRTLMLMADILLRIQTCIKRYRDFPHKYFFSLKGKKEDGMGKRQEIAYTHQTQYSDITTTKSKSTYTGLCMVPTFTWLG